MCIFLQQLWNCQVLIAHNDIQLNKIKQNKMNCSRIFSIPNGNSVPNRAPDSRKQITYLNSPVNSPQRPFTNHFPSSPTSYPQTITLDRSTPRLSYQEPASSKPTHAKILKISTQTYQHSDSSNPVCIQEIFNSVKMIQRKLLSLNSKVNKLELQIAESNSKLQNPENEQFPKNTEIKKMIKQEVSSKTKQSIQTLTLQNKIFNTELQTIKLEMRSFSKNELDEKMDKLYEDIYQSLNRKITFNRQICERQIQSMKKELQKFMQQQKNHKNIGTEGKLYSLIKINYELSKVCKQSQKISLLERGETIYCIDEDGYLLDENNFYLINESGEKIKILDAHIQLLKSQMMLD